MRVLPMLAMFAALSACAQPAVEENSSAEQAPDRGSAEREVLAVNAAYDRALVDGDAAALDRYYHDDFRIVDGNGAVHDKRNQIQFMTQSIDLLEGKGEDLQVEMLGPDTALLTGRFVARYRMDGKEADSTQRFTALYVRQGGEWQIRHEHVSNVPEKDGPQAAG